LLEFIVILLLLYSAAQLIAIRYKKDWLTEVSTAVMFAAIVLWSADTPAKKIGGAIVIVVICVITRWLKRRLVEPEKSE
jgi:hypothetical protein